MSSAELPEGRPVLTRSKLMLLGTLASTLIGVVWTQFSGEEEPKQGKKGKAAAHSTATPESKPAAAATPPAATGAPAKEVRPFPEISHDEIVQHDPFAMPDVFVRQQTTAVSVEESAESKRKQEEQKKHQSMRQQALNKLLDQGVAVVVRGDNGPAASIGSRLVHEGDMIDGFRVERIEPDGVILKEAPLP